MARRPDLGYFDEGLDLMAEGTYADARGGLGKVRPIAPLVYRSLAFAYLEDEAVWTRDWVCVGMVHDLQETGDLLPFTVGHHGIHVQRMPDGALEGRFNKAQHGGCRVVPVQCQGGTKTKCSFTSCGYSRDRDAIAATAEAHDLPILHQYLGLRPERLLRARVATLGPLVFVNLDPEAGALTPDRALVRHVDGLMGQSGSVAPRKRWTEFEANWKLLASHLAASTEAVEGLGEGLHTHRSLASGDTISALWLFPNLVLLSCGEAKAAVVVQHTATQKTLLRIHLFAADPAGRDATMLMAEIDMAGAMAEAEQSMLRRQQVGRPSPDTAGARSDALPRVDPVRHFAQQRLIDRVLALPRRELDMPMFQSVHHYSI